MKHLIYIVSIFILSCTSRDNRDYETISGLKNNSQNLINMSNDIVDEVIKLSDGNPIINKLRPHVDRLNQIILSNYDTSIRNSKTNINQRIQNCYKEYRHRLDTLLSYSNEKNGYPLSLEKENITKITSQGFQIYDSKNISDDVNYFLTFESILFQHYKTLRKIRRSFLSRSCNPDHFMHQTIEVQNNGEFSDISLSFYYKTDYVWVPKSIESITTTDGQTINILKSSVKHNKLYAQTSKLDPKSYVARVVCFIMDHTGEKWEDRGMSFYFEVLNN